LSALSEPPEAAFIAVPAEAAVCVLEEAGTRGIRAAVVNASGFSEAQQEQLSHIAEQHGIALCGPNTVGFINIRDHVALWTVGNFRFRPGPVAVVTQSGTASMILAGSPRNLGCDYVVCCGNEAGLSVSDYLAYFARDDLIRVILVFLETIRNPELFADSARIALERGKRIVALKVGRSSRGADMVMSHTGALAGDNRIYAAFLRQLGITTVGDLDEMVETAILFRDCLSQAEPRAPLLATFSGGVAALAADLAEDAGLSFPSLAPETTDRIEEVAPGVRAANPLDAWGRGWNEETFGQIVEQALGDTALGAVVPAVDIPADGDGEFMQGEGIARIFEAKKPGTAKALVLVNSGQGSPAPEVVQSIQRTGATCLSGLRESILALAHWSSPTMPEELRELAPDFVDDVRRGLDRLSRDEARATDWQQFVGGLGLRLLPSRHTPTVEQALSAADEFGYPVALKAVHPSIRHKTELRLVRLPLTNPASLSEAYEEVALACQALSLPGVELRVEPWLPHDLELILGVRNVDRFGSFCLVGLGGIYAEALDAVSVHVGPITTDTALKMLERTPAGQLLSGSRGRSYDIESVTDQLVVLSALGAAGSDRLSSIEVNPLIPLAPGKGAFGVDLAVEFRNPHEAE
jgi:acyl-CoA synthetase (NDP forming)